MFKNNLFRLLLATMLLLLPFMAGAQRGDRHPDGVKASGTVVDEAGLPVIGASVIEVGTTNGIITDLDGKFELPVKRGAQLEISCIGYVSVTVTGAPNLSIVLKEDNQILEETVVVGYGVQKKSSLTGAISSVKSEDLEHRTITTAQEALAGKTAGVQLITTTADPGSTGSIRIRGISSNASTDPLYVVDGVRLSDISGIDPSDIESMEVLKDAASAAIYGAEAGNGVVLITTKKGSKGNGHISYEFQYTLQSLAQKPQLLNSAEYIDYMTTAGFISQDKIDAYWDKTTSTDWVGAIFENSTMQKHALNFRGGNDKGNYYLSLGYLNNNGIVVGNNDTYSRLTATINGEYKITSWLTVGTTNNIARTNRNNVETNRGVSNLLISAIAYDPLTPISYAPDQVTPYMQGLLDAGRVLPVDAKGNYYGISELVGNVANPFALIDGTERRSNGFNINGSIYGNLTPLKGLTLTSRFGYRLSASNDRTIELPSFSYSTSYRDYLNYEQKTSTSLYYQWENFANYTHTWNQAHTLNAMAGFSFQQSVTDYSLGGLTAVGENALIGLGERFYHLDYATDSSAKKVEGEAVRMAKMSWFGRLGYEYKSKYMVQATLRADAADTAYLPAENRWGYFPSVSAGWVVSNEDFFESLRGVVNHLKFRASWGQNGSLASLGGFKYDGSIITGVSYPLLSGVSTPASTGGSTGGSNPGGSGPGAGGGPGGSDPGGSGPGGSTAETTSSSANTTLGKYPNALGNPDLKWETSEQIDLGVDARLFNDRLTVGIDWFNKVTKDLLVDGAAPSLSIGGSMSPINGGNVLNRGWEFELGWKDTVGDFHYGINGNLATLKNLVTYVDPSLDFIPGATKNDTALTALQEGYPIYYFRGHHFLGVDQETGDPIFEDVSGNGTVGDEDVTCIGDAIPDFTYGITLSADYKGFDVRVFGTGSQGNDIYFLMDEANTNSNKVKSVFYDGRWTPGSTTATRPRPNNSTPSYYNRSSAMVFDGSYFKIKQIQLGYSLPKNLLKKISLSKARIYASLDDFFIFTKYPGYSPDAASAAVEGVGIDHGAYPASKKIVFGVNVEF